MLENVTIRCPYCGESFESTADASAGSQHYIEDCAVCCRPIEVYMRVGDNGEILDISTATDND